MKIKPWILWTVLIVAYVLSSAVRMKFSLHDGYEFHGMWYSLISLPFFDAGGPPSEFLTSIFTGYIVFLAFGILFLIGSRRNTISVIIIGVLILLAGYGLYAEVSSIIQDSNSEYTGQHFRIGPTLLLLGIWLMLRVHRIKKLSLNQ